MNSPDVLIVIGRAYYRAVCHGCRWYGSRRVMHESALQDAAAHRDEPGHIPPLQTRRPASEDRG